MIKFPEISPTIVAFGPLQIRWYGLFYVLTFILTYLFYKKTLKLKGINLSVNQYESIVYHAILGVLIGGRLGYVIFYNLPFYLSHPLSVFAVWKGGMSFHGGALGVIVAGLFFTKRNGQHFLPMADAAMPFVAIGLGLGRVGNFINSELFGRVSDVPWAFVFPLSDGLPRHPSQLYESFFEGFVLFVISIIMVKRVKKDGLVFWIFLGLYGFFRFFIEFFREPDEHIGLLLGYFTLGQILSFFMVVVSSVFLYRLYTKNQ